jgi:hemerythrin-like domain-containing protein
MKRHKSLVPLSHDHHKGLVEARHLREGTAPPREAAERFLGFWRSELSRHFREEEDVLLPVFARHTDPRRVEIAETLLQHVEIRRGVDELEQALETGSLADTSLAVRLGELLHAHIRYEEDQVFPAIEGVVPEDELWRAHRLMQAAREASPEER